MREIWARTLERARHAAAAKRRTRSSKRYTGVLEAGARGGAAASGRRHPHYPEPPPRGAARQVATAVPLERLRALNAALMRVPEGFTVHRKLERIRERRRDGARRSRRARTIDWAAAEELAFASHPRGRRARSA